VRQDYGLPHFPFLILPHESVLRLGGMAPRGLDRGPEYRASALASLFTLLNAFQWRLKLIDFMQVSVLHQT
jgi:hypothetical protein